MNTGADNKLIIYDPATQPESDCMVSVQVSTDTGCCGEEDSSSGSGGISIHNLLSGLQGGTSSQRYHLSRTQWDAIVAANSPSGTNPFITLDDFVLTGVNGVTVTGKQVSLGGDLIHTTVIGLDNGDLVFKNISAYTEAQINQITHTNSFSSLGTNINTYFNAQNSNSHVNAINVDTSGVKISIYNGDIGEQSLNFSTDINTPTAVLKPIVLKDALFQGITVQWTEDQDNQLVDASYVPKRYVDSLVSGGSVTAGRGLLKTGVVLDGYIQVLSPGLDLTKVVITEVNGLSVLNNVLDTYTGESFSFKQVSNIATVADGVIVISLNSVLYKRQFTGYANLWWWGAIPDGVTDSTLAIQAALDSRLNIYVPGGFQPDGSTLYYRFTTLELKDRATMKGESVNACIFQVLPSTEPAAITIAEGPVTHVKMEDFYVLGLDTVNPGQHGFAAIARVDERNFDGGLWWSTFERVFINLFDGHAIHLVGEGAGFLPIQINYFESCEFSAGTNPNSLAMYQAGQVEQMQWTRCAWSGKDTNVTKKAILFDSISHFLGSGGGAQTFTQCYIGSAKIGMECHFAINQRWYTTYFEALSQGVADLYDLSTGILFDGSSFQASGIPGDGTGFAVRASGGSSYTLTNSHFYTQPDYVDSGVAPGYHHIENIYGFNKFTSKSEGNYADIEITLADGETDLTNGRININATRNGLNGLTNTTLKWIDSSVGPGKEFMIQSNFGFDINVGGNIFVLAPMRVFKNDSITIKRIDDYYHVTSYIPYRQDGATATVTQFGALGNGNNDTSAFQAAHDYVMKQGGGMVIIPFIASGYNISNIVCSAFCTFIGHNNVSINPITGSATEVFTMTGVPVIQHSGYRVILNAANPTQTVYNFTYTQFGSVSSNVIDTSYLTDFALAPNSSVIDTVTNLLPQHGLKLRIRINGGGSTADYIKLVNTGNIGIPTSYGNGIVLRDGDTVEFTLRDNQDKKTFTYLVTGLVRQDIVSATLPSQGQWTVGEKIINSTYNPGDNEGWVCTVAGNYAATPPTWEKFGNYGDQYTATNGLTRTGNNFTLGGTLTGTTTVETAGNLLAFGDSTSSTSTATVLINAASHIINLEVNNLTDALSNGVSLDNGVTQVAASKTGGVMALKFDAVNGVTSYIDTLLGKGIQYAADYSTNYGTRSLIDKGYADAQYGAKNGTNIWTGSNSFGGLLLGNSGFNHTILPEPSMTANYFNQLPAKSGTFAMTDDIPAAGMPNPMTTLGDIIIGGTSGAPFRLAGNSTTAMMFLTSQGSAGVATVPAYFDLFVNANIWTGRNVFNEFISLLAQVTNGTDATHGAISLDTTGSFVFSANSGFGNTFKLKSATTASRTWIIPDKNDTFAGLSDLGTFLTNPMTSVGDMIIGGASGTPTRFAGNTINAPYFLMSQATGGVAQAPVYYDLFGSTNDWTGQNNFHNTATFATTAIFSGTSVFLDPSTFITIAGSGGFNTNLGIVSSTVERVILFPDSDGIVMMRGGLLKGNFSATGTSGTPSFTITLPVAQSSSSYQIVVTATSAGAATGQFYISDKTTTDFKINYVTTISGTVTFDYVLID